MKTPNYFKTSIGIVALAVLTSFTTKAQITVTESDMPQAGNTYIEPWDTLPTVTPGPTGASIAWNLSAIKNDFNDSLFFVTAASTPYYSIFSSSNLACRVVLGGPGAVKGGSAYDYYNLNSNSFTTTGEYEVKPGTLIDTMNQTVSPLPITYKANWNRNMRMVEIIPGVQKQITKINEWDTVDGWGTVTTPAGSFNSLRVKDISITVYDSVFVFISNSWSFVSVINSGFTKGETFTWFGNGKGSAVAEVTLDSAGGSKTTLAYYLLRSITGVDEVTDNSTAQVYPNPASSFVNIVVKAANTNGYIKIIDLTGREIESASFSNGKAQFNTSGYADGMYLYLITDISGNLLDKGKFTVSH